MRLCACVTVVISSLLAVTPDDLYVPFAWQVSWLAGRGLFPPSLSCDKWHIGSGSPLTVAGAASAWGADALTEFPVRSRINTVHASGHQASKASHFTRTLASLICDAKEAQNAQWLAQIGSRALSMAAETVRIARIPTELADDAQIT